MKLLIGSLAGRLQRLPPLAISALGIGYVLGISLADYKTPVGTSFALFYMLGVAFVAWGAGLRRGMLAALIAGALGSAVEWAVVTPALGDSMMLWNGLSRLCLLMGAAWLTAEVTRLTRNLSGLAEERTAQWKAEAAAHSATAARLAEALERFEQLVNNIAEVSWLMDLSKSQVVYVSPACEQIYGRKCEEFYREPALWVAALHPEDRDRMCQRALAEPAAGGYDVECRILRPDGGVRWIRVRAFPVRNQQGEVYRIAGLTEDITEQKQTREVLQTQAAILENIAESVVVTDERGVIVQVNPAAERMWGYERHEMLGQPANLFSALPEPERTASLQEVLGALRATGSWRGTFKNRRKDGTIILCDAVMSRLEIQSRVLYVAVEEDVTERKRAEEALRQSEESLRAFMGALPAPACLLDLAGKVLLANRTMASHLATSEGELKGKEIFNLLPPKIPAVKKAFLDEVIRTAKPVQFDEESEGRHFLNLTNPVFDAAGNVSRVAVIALDITERKEAERALAQKEELYRTLFELSPDGILLEDANGNILDANRALCESSGYPREELLRQNVRCFVLAEDQPAVEAHLAMLRAGQALEHEAWNLSKRGERRLIRLHEEPLALPDGRLGILVVSKDVTESRRAELTKEVFRSLGAKLSAVTSPAEAARAVYAAADRLWKWDSATLSVYFPASDRMEPVLFCDLIEGKREEVVPPLPAGAPTARMRRVMQQGAELILRQEGDPPPTDAFRFGDTSRLSASVMCVPMHREDQPVGMLSIQSYTPNAYTQEDLRTLQALADYCGGALERIHAEAARKQSEELNRTILATAMDGYFAADFSADPRGALIDVNDAYCRMTGYSRQELLRLRIADLEAIESSEEITHHFQKLASAKEDRFETRHRRKDGQAVDVEISLSFLAGRAQRSFGFVRDITERKRADWAKEAFLSLGTQLSEVESPLAAAKAVFATADRLWQWDAAVLQLYSVERDCLDSVLLVDLVDGERREVPPPYPDSPPPPVMRRIMQNGPELVLRTPSDKQRSEFVAFGDVERLSASLMYAPLRRAGQTVGVLSIQSYAFNAYTPEDLRTLQALADYCGGALERIRAEEALRKAHDELEQRVQARTAELQAANAALRESEARLQLALDASDAGTWSWEAATESSTWDDRYRAHYGFDAGMPRSFEAWLGRVHPADRETLRAQIQAKLKPSGDTVWNQEFRILHPAKGERWMADLGRVERDAGGQVVRIRGISLDVTERKRAEEAQRSQLAQIEAIYETAPVGLCLVDANLRYLRINERLAAMNGIPAAWHIGRTVREAVPNLADRSEAACRQVIATGQEVSNLEFEGTTTAQPGVMRSWVTHWMPLKGPDGGVSAINMVVEEITEHKRAARALQEAHDMLEQRVQERTAELQAANFALRESEERYRSLVNNLNVGVYRSTPGGLGCFLQVNPALARMHGYDSVGQFQSVRVADLYQDPREREQFLAEVGRRGSVANYELRLKKKDGTPIYGSVTATAHRGPDGVVDWVDGVVEDVTERRSAAEELRASEERYRTLAESSPDAIFIVNRELKVEYVNSVAAALWRGAPNQLLGRTQPDLFPRETAQYHERVLREVFETGALVRRDEPLAFPTGDQWIEIRLAPLYGPQGTVSSVMGVCRDITERKRAEQQLAEALDLNQKMLAAATMGIAAYRATGQCLFANEALARGVGGSLSAVMQGNFRRMEFWCQSGLLRMADEALSQGQARTVEVHTTSRFGKSVWADCLLVPFVSKGQPHLLLMASDISERKQAESLLEAQRDLGVSLSTTTDLTAALQRLLDITMQLGGVDSGGVYMLNEGSGGMDLVVHRGVSPAFVNAVSCWAPDSAEARLAREGRAVYGTYRELPVPQDKQHRSEGLRAIAFVPLASEGKIIGALTLSSHLTHEIPRQSQLAIEAIAAQAAGAITRIQAEVERHRLEHQLLEISDREQARIGHDIHDGLCQHLVSMAFDANSLRQDLSAMHRPEAKTARRIARHLDQAITESRRLARGLFPVRLETEGLPPALEELAKTTRSRFQIRCRFTASGPVTVPNAAMATHLYRIAQEAVSNAVRHSRARSLSIRLRADAGKLELRVEDDGTGLSATRRKKATGLGLHIMDYRARTIGGALRLRRGRRGGTLVSCCVPRRPS